MQTSIPAPHWSPGAIAVTGAAAALVALAFGLRAVLGMFLGPINTATGVGFATVSFALALSQLVSGVAQPLCGAFSDRFGPARVVFAGGFVLCAGLALLPVASGMWGLIAAFGLIAAAVAAVGSMPVLLSAVAVRVHSAHRGIAAGVVSAGGSVGQMALAPLSQLWIVALGWSGALFGLAVCALSALPLAWVLRNAPARVEPRHPGASSEPAAAKPGDAFADPRYWCIAAGFLVCGFHVSFLLAHIPGVIDGCGLDAGLTGVWLGVLGLANVAGSIASGMATQRFEPKRVVAVVYAARAVGVAAFVAAPKTPGVLLGFGVWMGVTYLATVPPTSGLVAQLYGARHMGVLFGVVMFVHQCGSFLGIWLGGIAFERYGSYEAMWMLDIALALAAIGLNLSVRTRPRPTPDPTRTRPASVPADRSAPSAPVWHVARSAPASTRPRVAPSAAAGSG
jgi:predicted MFS family arabinose efflux permease